MNSKHINGTVSELIAMQYYTEKGYVVSKPLNDFNEYDLIIDDGHLLKKVQVKTIYFDKSKNRHLVSFVTSHIRGNGKRYNKKYKKGSFNEVCCVSKINNAIYIFPFEKIEGRRSLTIYFENVLDAYKDMEQFRVK